MTSCLSTAFPCHAIRKQKSISYLHISNMLGSHGAEELSPSTPALSWWSAKGAAAGEEANGIHTYVTETFLLGLQKSIEV